MLAGIVVNNAIVMVEQIEVERENGRTWFKLSSKVYAYACARY
jgi:multidrug efflux pump subunit AcrB